ncbi:LuxR C-terminal-related transcriptional regulator [Streptomyces sp. NPDC005407]|uniref:LuxR C-terminal-related transcriptional regulator n=1 Tax=Streptomyces sp. NPDC005407 TaxID=3155340 RepID=UPI00339E0EEE
MSVDLVDDTSVDEPNLLVIVRVVEEGPIGPAACADTLDDAEVRILALTADGATAAQIASAVGLTADGVNYHLRRLSRHWGVSGKAALVARLRGRDPGAGRLAADARPGRRSPQFGQVSGGPRPPQPRPCPGRRDRLQRTARARALAIRHRASPAGRDIRSVSLIRWMTA